VLHEPISECLQIKDQDINGLMLLDLLLIKAKYGDLMG